MRRGQSYSVGTLEQIRSFTRPETLWLLLFSLGFVAIIRPLIAPGATVFAQQAPAAGPDFSSPSAHAAVQYLFPEQIAVVASKHATSELHFRVATGLHINSHKPYGKNLIPTNLAILEQPGLNISSVDFPAGKDFAFAFAPTEKISVYSDEFILRAHFTAERGDHLLQGKLRYQACDASTCFPPKTIPVAIDVIAR